MVTTATGLTAAKMLELAGEQIIGGEVNEEGNLTLVRRNGGTIAAGDVFQPNSMPTFKEGLIQNSRMPSEFPVGVTYGELGDGFPAGLGVLETIFLTNFRASQTIYSKTTDARTFTRRAIDSVTWSPWRAYGTTPGVIEMTARATAPYGSLFCDGSAVSRTTYADLFAAIGTQFGAGDGSTTFNLPNLQGRVAVGMNTSDTDFATRGQVGGSKTHTLGTSNIPPLGVQANGTNASTRMTTGGYTLPSSGAYKLLIDGGAADPERLFANRGVTPTPVNHVPPYMALPYIIWI